MYVKINKVFTHRLAPAKSLTVQPCASVSLPKAVAEAAISKGCAVKIESPQTGDESNG